MLQAYSLITWYSITELVLPVRLISYFLRHAVTERDEHDLFIARFCVCNHFPSSIIVYLLWRFYSDAQKPWMATHRSDLTINGLWDCAKHYLIMEIDFTRKQRSPWQLWNKKLLHVIKCSFALFLYIELRIVFLSIQPCYAYSFSHGCIVAAELNNNKNNNKPYLIW